MDLSKSDTLCVYCGTDLVRIRKMQDREGLAKALYLATEGLDSDMGRWAETFDDLKEEGKEMWLKVADNLLRWMEE